MSADSLSRREVLALGAGLLASEEGAAQVPAPGAAAGREHSGAGSERDPSAVLVERSFVRLREGLVHLRSAGGAATGGVPLYLAHAGPGSSRAFASVLPALGRARLCIAPDMLGNGDSDPPANSDVEISYYADCALRIMDRLGLERVDFLGSHTGAQIGCELAVTHPQRVRRLILDGLPIFTEAFSASLLAHYAPEMRPDDYGGHLAWAWTFVRDQALYWPYFDRQPANRLANAVPSAEALHLGVTDVLKALRTYHIAYRAAFRYDTRARLAALRGPVLLMGAERDPLSEYLDEAARVLPTARTLRLPRTAGPVQQAAAIESFLAG